MDLIINKPRIENNKLISKIEYENKSYDLFFEVENGYEKCFCEDNANPFLIALIPFIVKHSYDVVVKSKISSKLYYQLTTYLLPLLCTAFKKKNIKIDCDLTEVKYNGEVNATSFSCGVDSFYTLLKHNELKDKSRSISHLCFFNAGSNGEFNQKEAEELYKKRLIHIKQFCEKYNYSLICINSNINELILMNHEKRHTFTTLACVFALEKLFKNYYFPSGFGFNGSHIDEADTAFYDILNVYCLSNENITFYSSGIETTRMEKIKYISNFKETYDWLNVCVNCNDWYNCGCCQKCIRTMCGLESIGKLENYKKVFNLKEYYKKRTLILSNLISENRDKLQHEFNNEILLSYKSSNIKIPMMSYVLSYRINRNKIKKILKHVFPMKTLRKFKKNKINDGWMD